MGRAGSGILWQPGVVGKRGLYPAAAAGDCPRLPLDANWTLAEDRAMRELVHKVIATKGDAIFRGRGDVPLPNNLSFKLMVSEDRELQKKRDA
jgi:hypothetical protein